MTSSATGDGLGRRVARNVAANALGRSFSIIAWLAITPSVVRALGAEGFGFWSLISTFAGLSLALDLGLSSSVTKYVAEYRAAGREAEMARTLTLALLASVALGLVWLLAAWFLSERFLDFAKVSAATRPAAARALAWMGVAFALNLMSLVVSAVITGLQRIDLTSRNLLLVTLLQLALIFAVIVRGSGLEGMSIAATVAALISLLLSWATLHRIWGGLRLSLAGGSSSGDHDFGRFTLALQMISLGVLVLYQTPKLFFTHYLSLSEVGDFELAWRVAFSAWSLPSLLLPPLLPAAAHLDATGDRVRLLELYRRASRYLFVVAFTLSAGMVALSGPLFTAWLGAGHGSVAQANCAIMGLLGINVLTSAGCLIARGLGRPWWEVGYLGIAWALQWGLGVWWVPRFGFQGGLAAMLVAGTVGTLWFLFSFHRGLAEPLGRFLRMNALIPASAAVVGGLAGWFVSGGASGDPASWTRAHALNALLLGGTAHAAVTLFALFASRFVTLAELRGVWSMVRGAAPVEG